MRHEVIGTGAHVGIEYKILAMHDCPEFDALDLVAAVVFPAPCAFCFIEAKGKLDVDGIHRGIDEIYNFSKTRKDATQDVPFNSVSAAFLDYAEAHDFFRGNGYVPKPETGGCACPMYVLMSRGCQCGGS